MIADIPYNIGTDFYLLVQKFITEDHLSHKVVKNDCTEIPSFYIENHHDAIIPREQFERVQLIHSMKRMQHSRADETMGACNQYPLGEKLRCPHCGSVLYQRAVQTQADHSVGWCCERGEHPCGGFVIRTRLVKPALLKAYEEVDLEAVKERQKDKKYRVDAKRLLSLKKETPAFETVDYWWVDDLIDHIEFGAHSRTPREIMRMKVLGQDDADDRVMKVFWRCGVVTTVPSGVVTDKDDPGYVAKMHSRLLERQRQKRKGDAE